jgi:aspartyl-tRNA(Asn)/glutamyl-tRNA(Gln) amidotransferase subunit C
MVMATVSREEVLKLARISQLAINQDDIDALTQQLNAVLAYAIRVKEVAREVPLADLPLTNVVKPDVVVPRIIESA